MLTGMVKFYDRANGYGVIVPDDGSGDIVVHQSAVEQAGLELLVAGWRLEFELLASQHEDDRQMTEQAKDAGRRCGRFAEDLWPL